VGSHSPQSNVVELPLLDELDEERNRLLDRSNVSSQLEEIDLLLRSESFDGGVDVVSEEVVGL